MAHQVVGWIKRRAEPRLLLASVLLTVLAMTLLRAPAPALLPAVALAWRPAPPEDRSDHPLRASLLQEIRRTPGQHVSALAESVGRSTELVSYHLSILEACGAVASEREGKYRTYYPAGPREVAPAGLLLLRDPTRRAIFEALQEPGGHTQRDLARRLGITQSAVSYHLRTLQNHGLLGPCEGWPARYQARSPEEPAPPADRPRHGPE
ncbi:MAG TPA: helix-turn-helix domain-containing protein [Candidatus Thermoplasmatota archaeon]|nr:helix-turn-helix domain-containing protein [Candidatus Thermoplasmatota archaeon]